MKVCFVYEKMEANAFKKLAHADTVGGGAGMEPREMSQQP